MKILWKQEIEKKRERQRGGSQELQKNVEGKILDREVVLCGRG